MTAPGPEILVRRLEGAEDLPLPAYETPGSVGLDLRAAITGERVIQPGEITAIATGLAVAIPRGFEGQVRPRSGLALRQGLSIPNAPGTIDADYRGEIQVILVNLGRAPVTITRGQRIAQLVIAPVAHATLRETATLDATARGAGGFGHTGT